MKTIGKKMSFWAILALLFCFMGCKDKDKDSNASTDRSVPETTGIKGIITDTMGAPVPGVSIAAGNVTGTSDASGKFVLEAPVGDKTMFRFLKTGYIPTLKKVDVHQGVASSLTVKMKQEASAIPLDVSIGGTITGDRGAQMTASANAFIDESGLQVSGTVNVHLTPFDPSVQEELAAVPNLSAQLPNGTQSELESFGLMDVTVRKDDQKLRVKPGETLSIRIPAPVGVNVTPPSTIPLWSFDEQTGLWQQEGTATYSPTEGVYEAEISHMSMWNCDQEMETTCIRGTVVGLDGNPVAGAYVFGQGADYTGMSDATTDTNGQFCLPVRKNSLIDVTIYLNQGGGISKQVSSGDVTVGIPPVCSSCSDTGDWVVQVGQYSGSDGETVDCEDVINTNPMAGTCAEDFWQEFALCFQPAGNCTMVLGGDVTWENGAKMTMGVSMTGVQVTYYNASGEMCGTAVTQYDIEAMMDSDTMSEIEMVYTLASGEQYTMRVGVESSNDITMVCPNGTEFVIDSGDQQALMACTGGGAMSTDTDDSMCEIAGSGDTDNPLGDLMNGCQSNDDCTDGNICCTISESGVTMSMCFPSSICDMMQESSS